MVIGSSLETGLNLPWKKVKNEYTLVIDTLRPRKEDKSPFKAKITFSRIILTDGTPVNPQEAAVAVKKEE